jgi:hypothetical protein
MPAVGASSRWSGCQDACLPSIAGLRSPLDVHPTRSAVRGPGVPPSAVQPSSVRSSGSLVRTRLSGRLVSSPSGAQPSGVSVRPPGRSRLVPRPPVVAMGTSGTAGDGHDWIESSSMWSGPVPAARSAAQGAMDAAPPRSSCRPAGNGAPRTWPGVLRREPAPGRPGRPDRREGRPVAGDCARVGELAEGRGCRTAPCGGHAALEPTTLRGRCGA